MASYEFRFPGSSHLQGALRQVEDLLERSLVGPPSLAGPAVRMLKAGGKRLRPALAIVSAAAADGTDVPVTLSTEVASGAAALELLHLGSLVHDDLMDHSTHRRGVPTIASKEGPDLALLVGDYLLGKANLVAARTSAAVVEALCETLVHLCEGQAAEVEMEFSLRRSLPDAISSIEKKTGTLLGASCHIGALCAARPEAAAALSSYGVSFGTAFQLLDDILDLCFDQDDSGKSANADIQKGVYTVPLLMAAEMHPDPAVFFQLLIASAADSVAAAEVRYVVRQSGAIGATLSLVDSINIQACEALDGLPPGAARSLLESLPVDYAESVRRAVEI